MNKSIVLLSVAVLFGCNDTTKQDTASIQLTLDAQLKSAVARSGKAFDNSNLTSNVYKIVALQCDKKEISGFCRKGADKNIRFYYTLNIPISEPKPNAIMVDVDDSYSYSAELIDRSSIPVPMLGHAYKKGDLWEIDSFTMGRKAEGYLTYPDLKKIISKRSISIANYDREALNQYLSTSFSSYEKVPLFSIGHIPDNFYFTVGDDSEFIVVNKNKDRPKVYKDSGGMNITEKDVIVISQRGMCQANLKLTQNDPESQSEEKREYLHLSVSGCSRISLNPFTYPKSEAVKNHSGNNNLDLTNFKVLKNQSGDFVDGRNIPEAKKVIVKDFGDASEKLSKFMSNFSEWDDFTNASPDAKVNLTLFSETKSGKNFGLNIHKTHFDYEVSFEGSPKRIRCNWNFGGIYFSEARTLCMFDNNIFLYKRPDNKYAVWDGRQDIEFAEK
ncbi:hypothetical protein NM22_17925 [Vibrio tubiashii]|nr:hypothetical protein NM22_17925 [Vibrio tubiashii]